MPANPDPLRDPLSPLDSSSAACRRFQIRIFGLADELGHGSHRTVNAPGSRLKKHHGDNPQHRGREHNAVKPKGELRRPGSGRLTPVSPIPGQPEGPKQGDNLTQLPGAGHSPAHFPHPTQRASSTRAQIPLYTVIACRGHTFTQQPQATQSA